MSGLNPETNPHEELRASNSNQHGDDGVRDTSPKHRKDDEDTPPEQAPGAEEVQPDGLRPAAGYPSLDPRSEDKPYKDAQP